MSTKGRISHGNVEVDDDDFEASNVRRRISIMIPEDVISRLTTIGKRENEGYQTVINRILREAVSSDDGRSVTERLDSLENTVRSLVRSESGTATTVINKKVAKDYARSSETLKKAAARGGRAPDDADDKPSARASGRLPRHSPKP